MEKEGRVRRRMRKEEGDYVVRKKMEKLSGAELNKG